MHFDLFHECANPPWLGRGEAALFRDVLGEIEWADGLGWHGAWLVEHHFTPSYSHSSKPDLLLAILARTTVRLRLGFAVIPLPYHHPLHVAERVAMLDVLSGGRLEVGVGRGFSPGEFAALGVPMEDSRARMESGLAGLRASFREDSRIVPRTLQDPGPPLWAAAVSPESVEWAAREGLGLLLGPFKPWFLIRQDIERYRAAWAGPGAARIGLALGVFCLPDAARARALARPTFEWFYRELLDVTRPVLERWHPGYAHQRQLGRWLWLLRAGVRLPWLERMGMAVVGDPAHCRARLRLIADAGVTHLLCAVGAGAMDSAVTRASIACIAREVMPEFA